MTNTTIKVDKKIAKELMLFKIQAEAKNINEVLIKAIQLLKEHEKVIRQ